MNPLKWIHLKVIILFAKTEVALSRQCSDCLFSLFIGNLFQLLVEFRPFHLLEIHLTLYNSIDTLTPICGKFFRGTTKTSSCLQILQHIVTPHQRNTSRINKK